MALSDIGEPASGSKSQQHPQPLQWRFLANGTDVFKRTQEVFQNLRIVCPTYMASTLILRKRGFDVTRVRD
jgi:hypothetical protein